MKQKTAVSPGPGCFRSCGLAAASIFGIYIQDSFGSSEVQCGHLVASTGISLLQNGQIFVVGASAGFGFSKVS